MIGGPAHVHDLGLVHFPSLVKSRKGLEVQKGVGSQPSPREVRTQRRGKSPAVQKRWPCQRTSEKCRLSLASSPSVCLQPGTSGSQYNFHTHSKFRLRFQLFNQCLLNTCYVPGTLLDSAGKAVNRTNSPSLLELTL